ncbi:MAP3K7 C-terminal-like protein [Amia ocellicauda]|uniref:MAP3K7 C-terminal-like protein n=1 Tax=Amia ocellicauda TaxID=2972642 RepID=UPI0034644156
MITTTRRVSPEKPEVRIAFSLNDSRELKDAEDSPFPSSFPELEQQLQPLPPCHSSTESMQVYKDHCKMAKEFHDVKKEIALLEERKKELIAELVEDEKVNLEVAQLEEEFRELTEENQTLITVHSQRSEQLEKLRVLNQKRQGSS